MAEMKISRGDIASLGSTLDGLSLPDEQRMLLSAIVTVGSETLAGTSAPVINGAELAVSFRDQFASSFQAGMAAGDGGVTIKIGR